ncbi:cell wall protein AWA1 [Sphaeramia orbicularis]|uniref:cell wall protein AWA1 n=1 Tax=Sphaeramia orbicularis TaxID=375764 RepID=UPI00117CD850|nr:cell wall protein AWA1-like [Sphaeramia orbicularis]
MVSMVVILSTTVSTAPVEEKEHDDDSKSQDKIVGILGVQQPTTVAASRASGVSEGAIGSSHIQDQSGDPGHSSVDAAGGLGSSATSQHAGSAVDLSAAQPAGPDHGAASTGTVHGADGVDAESNGNGQKLLNGGGVDNGQTGGIDPSSHDFLLSVMGGADPFGPDVHVHVPDHTAPPTQLDAAGGPGPDSQSASSSVSGSSQASAPGDSPDSPDSNGNGRQTLLSDAAGAVTDGLFLFNDLQTQNLPSDLTAGGAESVTILPIDLTASGLGLGQDVTESSPVILHTESSHLNSYTQSLQSVSGQYSQTDLATIATGTETVTADVTATPPDSSHAAVTDHTQTVGTATEQYNPSGQGPEGAENVELEDTC